MVFAPKIKKKNTCSKARKPLFSIVDIGKINKKVTSPRQLLSRKEKQVFKDFQSRGVLAARKDSPPS